MVNLVVDLGDERFGAAAMQACERAIAAEGFSLERADRAGDTLLAWLDQEFGGAWSYEAYAGKNIVLKRNGAIAGFATYAAQGIRYRWLRSWRECTDAGIFGPFGLGPEVRGTGVGRHLLRLTLCALRAAGYRRALIPAVGGDGLIAYYVREAGARICDEFDLTEQMPARMRTTVLASGAGTNFQAVIDAVEQKRLPLELGALVTNNACAYALTRAEVADIPTRLPVVWDRNVESRQTYDARLLHAVRQTEPALILLLGWMHLLPEAFVRAFPEMMNIHPAFLPHDQTKDSVGMPDGSTIPAFRGAHAVADAIAHGSTWVGATAHRVTLGTDRGPVLVRMPLAIDPSFAQTRVMEQLRPIEHSVLLGGIRRWLLEREG